MLITAIMPVLLMDCGKFADCSRLTVPPINVQFQMNLCCCRLSDQICASKKARFESHFLAVFKFRFTIRYSNAGRNLHV